jgi:hypothetical protein
MAAGSEPEPAGEAANGEPPPPPAAKQQRTFRLEVITASEVTRLAVCGNFQALSWDLGAAYDLKYTEASGNQEGSTVWRSDELTATKLPLRFKFVGNGHRSSPNTRPLIWDSVSRVYDAIPESGLIRCDFEPTPDNSDTGWVTGAGVGAYQLRVGQPPGSTQPLVALEAHLGHTQEEVDVVLVEAKPNDPAVPDGKVLARVGDPSCPTCCTYLLNSQSIESLAFRVDVLSRRDGSLLARCFVEPQTLQALEGTIRAALVTPDLRHAGAFHATFLVVSHLPHPANNLGNLQRTRWVPGGNTLDIGHRGSGASKVQGHNVRENTLLSFQKAALNHSEFIEFDVSLGLQVIVALLMSTLLFFQMPALNHSESDEVEFDVSLAWCCFGMRTLWSLQQAALHHLDSARQLCHGSAHCLPSSPRCTSPRTASAWCSTTSWCRCAWAPRWCACPSPPSRQTSSSRPTSRSGC